MGLKSRDLNAYYALHRDGGTEWPTIRQEGGSPFRCLDYFVSSQLQTASYFVVYNQDTTELSMTAIALSTVITTQINCVRSNSHVNICHISSLGSSHFQLEQDFPLFLSSKWEFVGTCFLGHTGKTTSLLCLGWTLPLCLSPGFIKWQMLPTLHVGRLCTAPTQVNVSFFYSSFLSNCTSID